MFEDYPPRIWLMFEHKPVKDKRRAEAYGVRARLTHLKDEEIESVADFVASIIEEHNLRAKKDWVPGKSGTGRLNYTLKPHYGDFEVD